MCQVIININNIPLSKIYKKITTSGNNFIEIVSGKAFDNQLNVTSITSCLTACSYLPVSNDDVRNTVTFPWGNKCGREYKFIDL